MIKRRDLFILIAILFFSSCISAQNLIPMYGAKNHDEYKYDKADEKFVKQVITQFGTRDSAYLTYIHVAWNYFYEGKLDLAIKRFNQCWLLIDTLPEVYYGFAGISLMRNQINDANNYFETAEKYVIDKKKQKLSLNSLERGLRLNKNEIGLAEVYERIVEIEPIFKTFYNLGYYKSHINKNAEAIIAFSKALELKRNDTASYHNRAYLYFKR